MSGDEAQDVFFKIKRKSRKEKDKSLVTMIAAKSGLIPEGKVKGAETVPILNLRDSVSFNQSFQVL